MAFAPAIEVKIFLLDRNAQRSRVAFKVYRVLDGGTVNQPQGTIQLYNRTLLISRDAFLVGPWNKDAAISLLLGLLAEYNVKFNLNYDSNRFIASISI